LWERPRKS